MALRRPAGQRLLAAVTAQRQAGRSSLQIQRQMQPATPSDLLRAALYVLDQRQRAQAKFGPRACTLFADSDGLEMASAGPVARHRAQRFGDAPVADLCCGIGGDLLALAERGPCIGVDLDEARLHMAHANTQALAGAGAPTSLILGDARQVPTRAAAAVVDPARRRSGRRQHCAAAYDPPLGWIETWNRWFTTLAVKVSPSLDLSALPLRQEVEYVAWAGQCREAVLWYGKGATSRRRASLAGGPTLCSEYDTILRPPLGTPGAFLLDPNPAVVRSHLIGELAAHLDAWLLAAEVAYLSCAAPVSTPWARCFAILQQLPFQLKRLRRALATGGWRPGGIRRRHFPIEPEILRRQLGPFDAAGQPVELVCTRIETRPTIFICAPVVESAR